MCKQNYSSIWVIVSNIIMIFVAKKENIKESLYLAAHCVAFKIMKNLNVLLHYQLLSLMTLDI